MEMLHALLVIYEGDLFATGGISSQRISDAFELWVIWDARKKVHQFLDHLMVQDSYLNPLLLILALLVTLAGWNFDGQTKSNGIEHARKLINKEYIC